MIVTDKKIIGKNVKIGSGVIIKGKKVKIGNDVKIGNNTKIYSLDIEIGDRTRFDGDSRIIAYDKFKVGKDCIIRRNARFKARTIEIGNHFFSDDNLRPLIFGGGGSDYPTAHLKIGNRCVIHDTYINVCMPVIIGDDVGLSPNSSILTHGFWNSVIEGYNSKFAGVKIGNNSFVGYGATILMGVTLGDYVTVGAKAVVTKSFPSNSVIVGVPAKMIKSGQKQLTLEDKVKIMREILKRYFELLKDKIDRVAFDETDYTFMIFGKYKEEKFIIILVLSPITHVPLPFMAREIILSFRNEKISKDDYLINLSNYTWRGKEDEITDDLRDFLRKYGIRIFSKRWFKSIPSKSKRELELL